MYKKVDIVESIDGLLTASIAIIELGRNA